MDTRRLLRRIRAKVRAASDVCEPEERLKLERAFSRFARASRVGDVQQMTQGVREIVEVLVRSDSLPRSDDDSL